MEYRHLEDKGCHCQEGIPWTPCSCSHPQYATNAKANSPFQLCWLAPHEQFCIFHTWSLKTQIKEEIFLVKWKNIWVESHNFFCFLWTLASYSFSPKEGLLSIASNIQILLEYYPQPGSLGLAYKTNKTDAPCENKEVAGFRGKDSHRHLMHCLMLDLYCLFSCKMSSLDWLCPLEHLFAC